MFDIPTIETPRFRLRAPTRADFAAYAVMWADQRVTRYINGGARSRTESWAKFLAMTGLWSLMGYGYWTFTDRRDDSFVGNGGFSWFDRGVPQLEGYPEAGWAIAPAWWGKGAASEIMAAALGWADHRLDAPEVRCIINPGHIASERVAAKCGFTQIGHHVLGTDPVIIYARLRG